jgi:hypothetical protein
MSGSQDADVVHSAEGNTGGRAIASTRRTCERRWESQLVFPRRSGSDAWSRVSCLIFLRAIL